jgi:hypothetical protein
VNFAETRAPEGGKKGRKGADGREICKKMRFLFLRKSTGCGKL